MHDIIQQLDAKRAKARLGGGEKRIAAQHGKGKLTPANASSCCSTPTPSKRWTCSSSTATTTSACRTTGPPGRRRGHRLRHDQRPPGVRVQPGLHGLGGALCEAHAEKICKVMDQAMKSARR